MQCTECETIDDYFFATTKFWFFGALEGTTEKLSSLATETELDFTVHSPKIITINVPRSSLDAFLVNLPGTLEGPELGETKVITTSVEQDTITPEDVNRVALVDVLVHRYKGVWLIEALEKNSYESWYQPIVHAENDTNVFAHEALFRLRDDTGGIIPPHAVFTEAEHAGLLFPLDLAARRSAVTCASEANLKGKIFINFNPSAIYDPAYCLRTTQRAIYELGYKPEDIIFEVTETHQAKDINHLKGIIAFYRQAGFGVALDDIGSGWSGLNLLDKLRPDYIKIDMDLIHGIEQDIFKETIVKYLIQIAHTLGIKVIAEGIETYKEAATVKELGADYLQGFFYGKPQSLTPIHK
ncbi:signal transduction protein [Kordiimonas sediminis]|uniref:Signal transduction protein n=1 Tax=Kordiimonas sediminis TaxID=1735581 RepID=A0A919E6T3_9PROT|nr:EAL domain-containing protein [Kordiimonas sediminis]GHF17889.1 signal transduction protein [Kordiimonas sediminis]